MLSLTGNRTDIPKQATSEAGQGKGVAALLRLEGAAALGVALVAHAALGAPWWLFAVLFLAPDIGMAAYLAGPRYGAWGYNALHTYLAPAALGAVGYFMLPAALPVAVIWVAHIGFDRAMGYGLKLEAGFGHTHLGRVGRG